MKSNKKLALIVCVLAIMMVSVFAFAACGGDDEPVTPPPSGGETGGNPPPPEYAIKVANTQELFDKYSKDVYDILLSQMVFSNNTPDNVYFTITYDEQNITKVVARYFVPKEDGKEVMGYATLDKTMDATKFINKDQTVVSSSFSNGTFTYKKCDEQAIVDAVLAKENIDKADVLHISFVKKSASTETEYKYTMYIDLPLSRVEVRFEVSSGTTDEVVNHINNGTTTSYSREPKPLGTIMIDKNATNKVA